MQFTTATLISVLSALAAAAPAPQSADPQPARFFGVLSLKSGDAVHLSSWQASLGGIFAGLNATTQNAPCDDGTLATGATFNVRPDDGAMFLLHDKLEQQLWVDRGMGQGIVRYKSNGGVQPSRQAELTGFEVVNEELTFKGKGFIACPGVTGYTIFVDTTDGSVPSPQPAGNTGCVGVKAKVVFDDTPVSCNYTPGQ